MTEKRENKAAVAALLRFSEAKQAEEAARMFRLQAERELVAALEFDAPEGSQTYEVEHEHTRAIVVLKRNVTRTVDADEWKRVRKALTPKQRREIIREKFELNLRVARKFAEQHEDLWREVASCVTTKPGKVSVAIKALESTPDA